MKLKINRDYYDIGEYLYTRAEIDIESGINVLVGCNGAGKSTLIHQIKDYCEHNKIFCIDYDNLTNGGGNAKDSAAFHGDFELLGTLMTSSEGECIYTNIGTFAGKFGSLLRKISSRNFKEYEEGYQTDKVFIIFDAVDSGLSIDLVIEIKDFLKRLVIPDCERSGISPYIIISTNAYEFANGEECIDIQHMKRIKFKDYEQYKQFVIDSAIFKSNREKSRKKGKET